MAQSVSPKLFVVCNHLLGILVIDCLEGELPLSEAIDYIISPKTKSNFVEYDSSP